MDEYNTWRLSQGLSRVLPRFSKSTHTIFVSDEALAGLKQVALSLKQLHGEEPSISRMLESIGLNFLLVTDPTSPEDYTATYVDEDGLTEKQCYELGEQDYNEKKHPNFHSSALNGMRHRSERFREAYLRGYSNAFRAKDSQGSTTSQTIS